MAAKAQNGPIIVCGLMFEAGGVFINDTKKYDGDFCCCYPFTDCVIDKAVFPEIDGKLNGVTLKANYYFYAHCTSMKLVSGTMIIYNRVSSLD